MLPETHWVNIWPDDWLLPADRWINNVFDFASKREFFGSFTGKDIIRSTIPFAEVPTKFIESLLISGFTEGFGAAKVTLFPPFSWLGLSIATVFACYRIGGTNLAMISFVTATPSLATFPETLMLSTGSFFDALIKWININLYDYTNGLKVFLLLNIFFPFKNLLLALPWPAFVILVGIAGYFGGSLRRGLFLALLTFLIVWVGLWERAVLTFYLCAVAVFFAAILGIPLGVWAGRSKAAARIIIPIVDTLQTLPAFIYLIPVIMLFGTGDFPSFIAIALFSICPAIRYTEFGIRTVPSELREAGIQFGCNSLQRLCKVDIPTAGPQIILGLNRTIMMALAMLVVTALIGTSDLGQETITALTKVDPGRGLVAGFAVAFIAIIADRLVGGLAESKLSAAKSA